MIIMAVNKKTFKVLWLVTKKGQTFEFPSFAEAKSFFDNKK